MGAAASANAGLSGNASGMAMMGLAGALTLIVSAHSRVTAPRVACRAEPVTAAAAAAAATAKAAAAAKAASAASGAANAAKAAGAASGAANAAKAAGAASGAAKAVGAVAGSAGTSTMYKAGEENDDSTSALSSGRKFFPQDRGKPEYEEYMRQLRKQKEDAWELRTARNPDGNFGANAPKKGDLYDPLMAGEPAWLDSAQEAGLYTGEFQPEFQVGVTEPLGFFDPLGFTKKGDKKGFSKLRAAEIKHGRVAMMAALGAVVQHYVQFPGFKAVPTGLAAVNTPPGSYGAIALFAVAGALETGVWTEKPNKEPGNFGDPLGFDQYTEDVRNRELNNGRFAMFAAIGIIAAELLTGKDAIEQFGFK